MKFKFIIFEFSILATALWGLPLSDYKTSDDISIYIYIYMYENTEIWKKVQGLQTMILFIVWIICQY